MVTKLKNLTVPAIRKLGPCYDPIDHVPETWTGTLLDVLRMRQVTAADKIWLASRPRVLTARTQRLFAVWCARRALKRVKNPDPRSVAACDVAERFANGKATRAQLDAAYAADAADAAADAYAAERRTQVRQLIKMIEEGAK